MGFPIRLVGVTPYRGHLEKFHMGAWTPVCLPTSSDKARLIAADACQKIGYNDVLDVTLKSGSSNCAYNNCTSNWLDPGNCTAFGRSGFVSCRVSDVDSIFVRLSARSGDRLPFSDWVLLDGYLADVAFQIGVLWREICFPFNRNALDGICRSLGYDNVIEDDLYRWWSSERAVAMNCSSKEIEECTLTESRSKCYVPYHLSCSVHDGKVRLVDGLHESEGRVEVHFSSSWSGVCNDEWVVNNANVVCRQLGYEKAVAVSARRRGLLLPSVNTMYHVRCNGNETSLNDCAKERSNRPCKAAEVTCKENECKYSDISIMQ